MRRSGFLLAAALLPLFVQLGCASGNDGERGQRNFPQTALRGTLAFGEAPEVALNGRPARLAPGARIRDQNNMLVTPAAVGGNRFLVHYTVDSLGFVRDVWLLTPGEANVRPWPWTAEEAARWQFDWTAQTWSRP